MLHGVGIDLVHVPRISSLFERYGNRFLRKFLHPSELDYFHLHHGFYRSRTSQQASAAFIASRWAIKEAAYKAIGNNSIPLTHFSIEKTSTGKPQLIYHQKAKEIVKSLQLTHSQVSISHDTDYATAIVFIERANRMSEFDQDEKRSKL